MRQNQSGADAAFWTDGAEDIGRLGALVAGRCGTRSPFRPASGDLVLLADASFVLEPDF